MKQQKIKVNYTTAEYLSTSPAALKKNYPKFETLCSESDFIMLNKKTQFPYLLGKKQDCTLLAGRYIDARHKKREESTNQCCAPPPQF